MEIKRETTVTVLTTDGKEIHKGDYVVFNASGRCHAGHFSGISNKGNLIFESVISVFNQICFFQKRVQVLIFTKRHKHHYFSIRYVSATVHKIFSNHIW